GFPSLSAGRRQPRGGASSSDGREEEDDARDSQVGAEPVSTERPPIPTRAPEPITASLGAGTPIEAETAIIERIPGMPDNRGDEVPGIEQAHQQEEELHRASRRAGALRRHAIPSPRAFVCESARETSGAVPTDIPHFFARVLVLAYPDRLTGGGHLFFLQALL